MMRIRSSWLALQLPAFRKFTISSLLTTLLVASGCSSSQEEQNKPAVDQRPIGSLEDLAGLKERDDLNVLFVVIDTLRSDRMSAYGYERDTTPVLEYFVETGIRFDQHWAQSSWTKSSMASLWTTLYPARTEVLAHRDVIAPAAELPAEVLGRSGFVTAGIWRNGWVAPNFGFGEGFEIYQSPIGRQAPAAVRQAPIAGRIDGTDIDLVYSGIEFLRANGDRRWFLYLHMMDVHQYVTTPDNAIFGSTYSDAYDNSIRWVDEQVGMIMAELHALDLAKKTIVVFVSDHGEAFGEHGTEGHARDIFSEAVRTPFILIPPFKMKPGVAVPYPTENVDVWPTLYELLGIDAPVDSDGQSLVSLLLERRVFESEKPDITHLDRSWGKRDNPTDPVVGVRRGSYRYIHDPKFPLQGGLFDLRVDPGEKNDVAESQPEIARELKTEAEAYLELEAPWLGGAPQVELDEMHLRQLRALGYSVDD